MKLLVFKVNQLGDNVVFLPALQHLVERFPDWQVSIITSNLAAPLYRTTLPTVNVLTFETLQFNTLWKSPAILLNQIRKMRSLQPDVCLVTNDQGNVANFIARLTPASIRIGPDFSDIHLGFLLSHRVHLDPSDSTAQHNWQLVQSLLGNLNLPPLPLTPSPPNLEAFGKDPHGAIVIHPEASLPYQHWPLASYLHLANLLSKTHSVIWVCNTLAPPGDLNPNIQIRNPDSLASLISCLAGASFFVGNNSGPMHLASALAIPAVIPCGPSALNWDPEWNRHHMELLREPLLPCQPCDTVRKAAKSCKNTDSPLACLKRWSAETVHAKILSRLKSSQSKPPLQNHNSHARPPQTPDSPLEPQH